MRLSISMNRKMYEFLNKQRLTPKVQFNCSCFPVAQDVFPLIKVALSVEMKVKNTEIFKIDGAFISPF